MWIILHHSSKKHINVDQFFMDDLQEVRQEVAGNVWADRWNDPRVVGAAVRVAGVPVQVAVIAQVSVEAAELWLVWMIGKGKLSSTGIKETPITSFFSLSSIHTDAMNDESMVLKTKIYRETQQGAACHCILFIPNNGWKGPISQSLFSSFSIIIIINSTLATVNWLACFINIIPEKRNPCSHHTDN